MIRYSWTQTGMVRDPEGSFVMQSELEPKLWQWRDLNGNWINVAKGMYKRLLVQGATVRALAVVEQQAGRIDAS